MFAFNVSYMGAAANGAAGISPYYVYSNGYFIANNQGGVQGFGSATVN